MISTSHEVNFITICAQGFYFQMVPHQLTTNSTVRCNDENNNSLGLVVIVALKVIQHKKRLTMVNEMLAHSWETHS